MKKEKLMTARKAKKISQADVATYLKISQTQYQRREVGKIEISDQEWERIAELLNVPLKEIHEESDNLLIERNLTEELDILKEKIKILEMKIKKVPLKAVLHQGVFKTISTAVLLFQ